LEDSQKDTAYAYYVVDEKGVASQTWQLKKKDSAVMVLDRDGTVLYCKDGKLSDNDIASAFAIIKEKLAM
jgi:predicted transcriptional regulator